MAMSFHGLIRVVERVECRGFEKITCTHSNNDTAVRIQEEVLNYSCNPVLRFDVHNEMYWRVLLRPGLLPGESLLAHPLPTLKPLIFFCCSYLPWFEVFYKLLNNLADYLTKGQVKPQSFLIIIPWIRNVPCVIPVKYILFMSRLAAVWQTNEMRELLSALHKHPVPQADSFATLQLVSQTAANGTLLRVNIKGKNTQKEYVNCPLY